MARALLVAMTVVCLWTAPIAAQQTEEEFVAHVRELLGNEPKLDEAQRIVDAAVAQYPDSSAINNLQLTLSTYMSRGGRHDVAAKYMDQYLQSIVQSILEDGRAFPLRFYAQRLGDLYVQADKLDVALQRFDELAKQLGESPKSADESVAAARTELLGAKALLLASLGRGSEALETVQDLADTARKALEMQPTDVDAVLHLSRAMAMQRDVAQRVGDPQANTLAMQHAQFLEEQVKLHKTNTNVLAEYSSSITREISDAMRSDPDQAQQRLATYRDFLESLDTSSQEVAAFKQLQARSLQSLERRLETARLHASLIGQPAFPLGNVIWVNGSPLTEDELQGKVVLLDFWAVWCGPCIATFPHLREWQEKHGDTDLVIIGLTRHYQYGWNAEAKRPERIDDLAPADEEAALVQFAQHHQLKHRFAVTGPDSQLQTQYGVTGIPQAVLIDRHGKIRMIRVGSGESNARDLDQLIDELVLEQ